MNNNFICFIVVLFMFSCNNYPKEISKNNLEKKFDIARWRMYEANYRNEYIFFSDKNIKQNIVSCDLKLNKLIIDNDTIIMQFSFFYPDSNMVCYPGYEIFYNKVVFVCDDFPYIIADGFNPDSISINMQREIEKDTVAKIKSIGGVFYPYWSEQEKFKQFLKTTKYHINPWLKKEAIKKGILAN